MSVSALTLTSFELQGLVEVPIAGIEAMTHRLIGSHANRPDSNLYWQNFNFLTWADQGAKSWPVKAQGSSTAIIIVICLYQGGKIIDSFWIITYDHDYSKQTFKDSIPWRPDLRLRPLWPLTLMRWTIYEMILINIREIASLWIKRIINYQIEEKSYDQVWLPWRERSQKVGKGLYCNLNRLENW